MVDWKKTSGGIHAEGGVVRGEWDDGVWDQRWWWCCMSMYLVWMDIKCLGYLGLETVFVTREGVNNMMMFCGWL